MIYLYITLIIHLGVYHDNSHKIYNIICAVQYLHTHNIILYLYIVIGAHPFAVIPINNRRVCVL